LRAVVGVQRKAKAGSAKPMAVIKNLLTPGQKNVEVAVSQTRDRVLRARNEVGRARRQQQLPINVAKKIVFEPNRRGQKQDDRRIAGLIDMKNSQARRNHAPSVGKATAQLASPDVGISAANCRRQAIVDEDPARFGERARILEEEWVRDRADKAVEAMIARQ